MDRPPSLRSLRFRQVGGFALYAAGVSGLVVEKVAALGCGSGGLFVRSCPGVRLNNSIVRGFGAPFDVVHQTQEEKFQNLLTWMILMCWKSGI